MPDEIIGATIGALAAILGILIGYGVASLEERKERKKRSENIIRFTNNDKRF